MTLTPPPLLSPRSCAWFSRFGSIVAAHPFRPHRWLGNPRVQTLAAGLMRRNFSWGWGRCREYGVTLADGARIRVIHAEARPSAPTMIVAHGMAGSSDSPYMQALSHKAYSQGWNAVLLNLYDRNMDRTPPQVFHAGASRQLEAIIRKLVRSQALGKLFLVGVSMGGNMLLKMLAEWGSNPPVPVRAAAALSPLVDLTTSWQPMERFANLVFQHHFLHGLKKFLRSGESCWENFADVGAALTARTIRQFDEAFTAPVSGFRDADDYYEKASAAPLLGCIRVPTLIIHSIDDPFLPWQPFSRETVQKNPRLLLLLTRKGGHVGFVERDRQQDIDRLWAENRIIDYFRLALFRKPLPQ